MSVLAWKVLALDEWSAMDADHYYTLVLDPEDDSGDDPDVPSTPPTGSRAGRPRTPPPGVYFTENEGPAQPGPYWI